MKSRVCVVSVVALLCAAVGRPAAAQTADELIAKNLQAKGGLEKIRAVQTIKQTSRMNIQGMEGRVTIYTKRPNMTRQEMNVGGQMIVNAYDGVTAWTINPNVGVTSPMVLGGPQADAIREQSSFDGPLVDYKKKGYTIELVGLETLNNRKVHHLKVTDKNRQVQHYYLDATTGLETKVSFQTDMGGTFEQELSDFRDIEGIKIPFSIRTLANGVLQGQITVEKVEFNVKIDDAIFRMPK